MAEPARPLMTVAEFLAWDDGTDTRYELIDGVPVAMAPASPAHAFLAGNVAGLLYARLRSPCRTALEAGIARPESAGNSFLVADLAITCSPQPREAQWIIDPVVIVEVLSPSTVGQDRSAKLDTYMSILSVREILLVSSEERRAVLHRRVADGWLLQHYIGDAAIPLESVGVDLPLAELYRDVPVSLFHPGA
jgi:Uma2 family endonuclease